MSLYYSLFESKKSKNLIFWDFCSQKVSSKIPKWDFSQNFRKILKKLRKTPKNMLNLNIFWPKIKKLSFLIFGSKKCSSRVYFWSLWNLKNSGKKIPKFQSRRSNGFQKQTRAVLTLYWVSSPSGSGLPGPSFTEILTQNPDQNPLKSGKILKKEKAK